MCITCGGCVRREKWTTLNPGLILASSTLECKYCAISSKYYLNIISPQLLSRLLAAEYCRLMNTGLTSRSESIFTESPRQSHRKPLRLIANARTGRLISSVLQCISHSRFVSALVCIEGGVWHHIASLRDSPGRIIAPETIVGSQKLVSAAPFLGAISLAH